MRECCAALIMIALPAAALAQSEPSPLRADGNGIAALRTVVHVDVVSKSRASVLTEVLRGAGVEFVLEPSMPGLDDPITLKFDGSAAASVLRVLRGSTVEAGVRNGTLIFSRRVIRRFALVGRIRSVYDSAGVLAAVVRVSPAGRQSMTSSDGRYRIENIESGSYHVCAAMLGFAAACRDVTVDAADKMLDDIYLQPVAIELADLVVVPGRFSGIDAPTASQMTMTREEIETQPQLGDDLFRVLNRLPGISATDFSAAFRVRGGANDQMYIQLDGMQLIEPFHLKDFDGAISILDPQVIGGVDVTLGGFDASYGNRQTGVLEMRSLRVTEPEPRTTLGLSITSVRAQTQGRLASGRASWLVSLRRGYLDLAFRLAKERSNLTPIYNDGFARVQYVVNDRNILDLHFLHSGDRLAFQNEPGDPRLRSRYGSDYAWLTWSAQPSDAWRVATTASLSMHDWQRDGVRDGAGMPILRDKRDYRQAQLKSDATFSVMKSLVLRAGLDVRSGVADYEYAREQDTANGATESVPAASSRRKSTAFGTYMIGRVQPVSVLTIEGGVRYDLDDTTHISSVSPRGAAALDLGSGTTIRVAAGSYVQAQGLYELEPADIESSFQQPERSRQLTAGIEKSLPRAVTARVEVYRRSTSTVRPRYETLVKEYNGFDDLSVARRLIAPASGVSRGLEIFARRAAGNRIDGSISYAYAESTEEIDGGTVARPLDQRHALNVDLSWQLSSAWRVTTAWRYHSGWPVTPYGVLPRRLSDNTIVVDFEPGAYNSERLPAYHRLDARISRRFERGRSNVLAYVDLFNVYNRVNAIGLDYFVIASGSELTGHTRIERMLPFLPSFGISWTF